jgi:hypothetical protein
MKHFFRLLTYVMPLLFISLLAQGSVEKPNTAVVSSKLRSATYDGKWSGVVKCLYDPGLWPDDECDVTFTFDIHRNALAVEQIIRSKKGEQTKSQINPGKFQFVRLATNAVAISLDSGNDEDGTWVETWSFAMTLKDPDHMIVHWTRIVNNIDMPLEKKGSKFSSVGMGEFVRLGSKP